MTIANPIYDIVFKYLMEDLDIAKGLLSVVLGVEIVELTVQPQETISETPQEIKTIRVYRIDFAAVIKQADGQTKKVLIELQKTKRATNAIRFRRYLAENYQKEDTVIENGRERKRPLELITIYLLGFNLNKIPTAILHSKPFFKDIVNNTDAHYAHSEEFVKLLTHESYFIQIPKLVEPTKTRIEKILSIFNQTSKNSDDHTLQYNLADDDEPLLQKMVVRLTRAIADEDMRRRMNVEDEIETEFTEFQETIEQKDEEIRQNKQAMEQYKLQIEALMRQLAEKNQ